MSLKTGLKAYPKACVKSWLGGAALLLALSVSNGHAQGVRPTVSAGVNSVSARARALADAGNGAKARELLDSLVSATPRESDDAAEALYWRAMLSEQPADAERDWKRLIVEVPFSPRASDALLRLAELDLTRNEAAVARQRVQRLLSDHPDAPERPRALLVLARTYFVENDSPRACGVLTVVRREAPLTAVEVRLQADELQQQCRNVHEVAMGAAPDSTTRVAVAPPVTTPVTTAPPVSAPPVNAPPIANNGDSAVFKVIPHPDKPTPVAKLRAVGKWTVQIAAYDTRAQADALVKRLSTKHIDAHSAGSKKPFRVQVGRYATRAEATSELTALKKKGQTGFVAEVGPP